MGRFAALQVLEDGLLLDYLLRALTFDDLCVLCQCDGNLARQLASSRFWLHAAIAEAPFLRLEPSCFKREEHAGVIRALRVLRKAVPARGLSAPLGSASGIEELASAVSAASLASALHKQRHRGFAAPVVGLLRWQDEAALLSAMSPAEPKVGEFCLSAPISLPLRESQQLAAFLGLSAAALGPPLPMRLVFAWRAGRLLAAVSMGGLVPNRLQLPEPAASPAPPPLTSKLVQVTIRCLDPQLPLAGAPLTVPVGRQWVAVPLELPPRCRAAAAAAMVRGALLVVALTDLERVRVPLSLNSLHLHPLRGDREA
ncbi:unnamed protein product [Prorocentrum cordatum]|uniref:Anaphase-promoting complex subunit 1 n=1 Tax=Prorocentrum cordatum TaxID=2364126 RepID=A0ABN9XU96_9DINO|nr:unnamed protein product [Polarella glacialis]